MAALPEGWEVVPLESLLVHPKALTYGVVQPGKPQTDGVPIVRVGDIRQGRVDTISPMRIAPAVEASYERSRIEGGELLITLVGTVGEAAVAPVEMAGWNAARAVAVARVRPDVGSAWVCRALRLPIARDRIAARLNTTVQATLNLSDLRQVPVVLPPPEIRGEVARTADALDDRITSNLKAISLMEQLGSALLDEQLTFDEAGNMKVRALPLGDFLAVLETGSRPKGGVTASVEGVASLGAENVRPAGVGTANPSRSSCWTWAWTGPIPGRGCINSFSEAAFQDPEVRAGLPRGPLPVRDRHHKR